MRRRAGAGRLAFLALTSLVYLAACGERDRPRATPRWAAMTLDRHGHRVEVVGDLLIAFGGFAPGRAGGDRGMRQCFTFGLPDGPWVERAPMTHGRAFFASAVHQGAVYALGASIETYAPALDRWTVLQTAPRLAKSHMGCAQVGGRVHLLGGYPVDVSGHRGFEPATGEVREPPPPPDFQPGDHFHLLANLQGRLHVVGGLRAAGSTLSDAHDVYDGTRWTSAAQPPTPLWAKFAAYAVLDDTLYVFAMEGSFAYEARSDRWRRVAPLPEVRAMPATVVLTGRIAVIGGRALEAGRGDVLVYDPGVDRWTRHGPPQEGGR